MQTNEFTFYELIVRRADKDRSLYTFQKPDTDNGQITVIEHTGILPPEMSIRSQDGKRILCEELYGASAETAITRIVNWKGDAKLQTEDGREVRAYLPFDQFQKQYMRQVEEYLPVYESGGACWTREASNGEKELVMQDKEGDEKTLANLSRLYTQYVSGTSITDLLSCLKNEGEIQHEAEAKNVAGPTEEATYRGDFLPWDQIKENIYIDTVCVTKNQGLLKKVPAMIKGDFAAVLVLGTEDGFTKPLTTEYLQTLGETKSNVFTKAIENTQKRFPILKYFLSVYQTEVVDGTGDPYDTKYKKNLFYRKVRIIQDMRGQHGLSVLFYPDFGETLKNSGKSTMYVIQDKDTYIAVPRELEISGYESAREWCDEFVSENNSDPDSPCSTYVHEFDPVDCTLLCNGKEQVVVDGEKKKLERRTFQIGR